MTYLNGLKYAGYIHEIRLKDIQRKKAFRMRTKLTDVFSEHSAILDYEFVWLGLLEDKLPKSNLKPGQSRG